MVQKALASQSLSIIFELIPYAREAFRRHLSQKQAVMLVEFDKLKRVGNDQAVRRGLVHNILVQDYQEHQNEIHSKLVAIMGDRLNAHIKSLKVSVPVDSVPFPLNTDLLVESVDCELGRVESQRARQLLHGDTCQRDCHASQGVIEVSLCPSCRGENILLVVLAVRSDYVI